MNPSPETATERPRVLCPWCRSELTADGHECTRCDWVRPEPEQPPGAHWRAAILSIIPGLGHVYKGQFVTGGLIFGAGNLVVLPAAAVIAPATLGVSLLIIPLFLTGVMTHAFLSEDLRIEARNRNPGRLFIPQPEVR